MAILMPAKEICTVLGANAFPAPKLWSRTRRLSLRWLWLTALLYAFAGSARAQAISHEYELKAVLIYNFAQFTDWPTNAFESTDSPFVIGILGNDPFGGTLETTVQNETLGGRTFVVKHFPTVDQIKTCHILYIGQSEAKRLDSIVGKLKGTPVLTLSDIENAAYRGVCVRFITENNKIHLRINVDSLKEANLVVSSKLLRVAEIVPVKIK